MVTQGKVGFSAHRCQGSRDVGCRDVRYLSTLPPEFNREQPSPEVKYVVVELAMDEPPGRLFTRTGYYLVPQLSPTEAETVLFSHE
mgnify:CR=1 FL=1